MHVSIITEPEMNIIWDYENNRDVFIIIVMTMLPLYNHGCINTMKSSSFPCLKMFQQLLELVLAIPSTNMYTTRLLQHIASLKHFMYQIWALYVPNMGII